MTPSRDISRLLEIMAALRDPEHGCPWDRQQTFSTIAPFTIEEAYEVADAIERCDLLDLRDELGDLLLQVVYHARLAQEQGSFAFGDVVEAITAKLIRRHPHVFVDAVDLPPESVARLWQDIKAQEKLERGKSNRPEPNRITFDRAGQAAPAATLGDVPRALPGLTRAVKLTAKAAEVGFDWSEVSLVIEKIREELAEVEAELLHGRTPALAGEIGDLLFAVANLARHTGVDPEAALRGTNAKFVRRFGSIEAALALHGRTPRQSNLAEMDRLWNDAKADERVGVSPKPLP